MLRGFLREHAVDERRPAVADRMADDAVLVGGRLLRDLAHDSKPLRGALREIGQNAVGAGAPDRQQGFERDRAFVDPAVPAAAMIIEYSPLT